MVENIIATPARAQIGVLKSLERLSMDDNPLKPPYAQLYAKDPLLPIAFHNLEVESLDISDAGLDFVPPEVCPLPHPSLFFVPLFFSLLCLDATRSRPFPFELGLTPLSPPSTLRPLPGEPAEPPAQAGLEGRRSPLSAASAAASSA